MLTNTERQQIVEEVNAGTYGIDEALDDIAAAQKGEEVRKALYAEALVLNREGHAGSTDMIARQQIANLQTSVNGQISTLRTEVGEDIDDLETALNSGLATQNGKIAAQNATIANVVANYNVEYSSTELWASTGETGALAAGTTVTLSEDVSHFDYIDIYSFCGNSNVLDTVPVDNKLQSSAGYALRWVNLSDPGSGSYKAYVRIVETRLHIIGTTLTIDHQVTYRNGEEVNISGAEITQSNRSTYMGELGIMKIVGRKITANTEIEDVRIGADGTEYASAGQAVRAQVTALESAIPAVDSTLSTHGAAADAKVAGDKVAELKSALTLLENDTIITEFGSWSQNRLMTQSTILIEVESNTFCHSDFINTGANAVIEVADGYKVFAWDGAYNELGHQVYQVTSAWSTGTINYTYRTNYPYLAICVMKANSANIVPSEAESAVKVYTSATTPFALKTTVNELSNDVSNNTKDIFEIKSTMYPSTEYFDYQLHNGKIVISNNAVTIQSDNTRAYTDYIVMDSTHPAYLSVQSGYKYYAYLVDNDEGISKTYSPISPFNAWMDTEQYINYDSKRPYLIVAIIKNPSGNITPEEAASALTIANHNAESVVGEINVLKYQTMANVPSSGQILYNADTNQQSNHIVNAVAYDDGVIIGCRSDGKVVRIGYSGTEETLLTVDGSNCDWRLCWKDSNENVYVSPHASNGTLAMGDRGLYKLVKGGSSFTKVISLYNTNSSVPTEAHSNNDTIWTMCEDASGNLYAGVYAHTTRANPAIYKSTDGGNTWVYTYKFSSGMHIHTIIYSEWQNALYCIVGEINTIYKSTDGATTWNNLNVVLKSKGSAMCATPYGILIGSDSAYNCEIDILLNNDVTHQTVFSGWANTVFAIRRSDLTGMLYAFTKVDSSVNVANYYPPISAITDSSVLDTWKNTSGHNVTAWTAYHDSVVDKYPDDAIRPQHCGILVSRDGGLHWDVLKRWELTNNGTTSTYVDGFWTTGFFKNGECLTGRLATNVFVNPVVISEGKHKYVSGGCDLSGEIFVRTNSSATVEVLRNGR